VDTNDYSESILVAAKRLLEAACAIQTLCTYPDHGQQSFQKRNKPTHLPFGGDLIGRNMRMAGGSFRKSFNLDREVPIVLMDNLVSCDDAQSVF